eukprot:208530-Pleurochrysis_carterae.AAC.2
MFRAMVSRRPLDGCVDVTLYTTARGGTGTVAAEKLISDSDTALPAIFSFGQQKGALAPMLRDKVHPAAISPHGD